MKIIDVITSRRLLIFPKISGKFTTLVLMLSLMMMMMMMMMGTFCRWTWRSNTTTVTVARVCCLVVTGMRYKRTVPWIRLLDDASDTSIYTHYDLYQRCGVIFCGTPEFGVRKFWTLTLTLTLGPKWDSDYDSIELILWYTDCSNYMCATTGAHQCTDK